MNTKKCKEFMMREIEKFKGIFIKIKLMKVKLNIY